MTTKEPQWQRALECDGFCVVPGVLDAAACRAFADSAWAWLEGFGHGFDPWRAPRLPSSALGGLYYQHAVQHEAFVWRVRACVPPFICR